MQTVYVDILILLNVIISFFLLQITSVILKTSPSGGKIFCGTVMGGAYSLLIFAPEMNVLMSLFVRAVMCISVVYVVYKPKGIGYLVKSLVAFLGVNFLFAGLMVGVEILFSPDEMQIKNGTVYFDFGFITLVLSAVTGYGVTLLLNFLSPKNAKGAVYNVIIKGKNDCVECKAMVDTGNTLTDPFNGEPVILADLSIAKKTADEATYTFIKNFCDGIKCEPVKGIRLIPAVTALGRGLIPVFKADNITVISYGKRFVINNAEIGISNCFGSCSYSVLLNPYLINERRLIKNEIKNGITENKGKQHNS